MIIEIIDQTDSISPEKIDLYKRLLTFCIEHFHKLGDQVEVSVAFVSNETIRSLNHSYRGIDQETDVLSFPLLDPADEPLDTLPLHLGDIVISIDQAIVQAETYNHSLDREIGFLIVHGFLHLLGYDHENAKEETIMLRKQKELLEEFGLER